MSGHRPFSELTKDFTEERWQHVATKRAKQDEVSLFYNPPSEKERKPKMSVSAASSYFRRRCHYQRDPYPRIRNQLRHLFIRCLNTLQKLRIRSLV